MYIIWTLGEIRDIRAVEPLIQALKDKNSDVYWEAAGALGKIGDERAIEPLIHALKDKHEGLQEKAAEALRKIGKSTVASLILALKDEDWNVREKAARVLGELKWKPSNDIERAYFLIATISIDSSDLKKLGEPAVKPLIWALKDKNGRVRARAARALGKIGDERAFKPLIHALKDKHEGLQRKAAETIGKIGNKQYAKMIIDYLFSKPEDICYRKAEYYKNMFHNYTELIIGATSYESRHLKRITMYKRFVYNIKGALNTVPKLCNIYSTISSNILHKVARMKNVKVIEQIEQMEDYTHTVRYDWLNFKDIREKAGIELRKRGNLPYNPSAYLIEDEWKI